MPVFIRSILLVACCVAIVAPAAHAASASSSPADATDKHIYAGQVDLATNLWGIRGAGSGWSAAIFTNADANMDGASYSWSGFGGDGNSVKAYPSLRIGTSNRHNDPAASGLPYRFGGNATNVDVAWDFTVDGIAGKYNHTLDVFFNAPASSGQAGIRGEIMVITDSSQDARTAGWGARDAEPFVVGGATWEVWQATQKSNGYSWHVTQFRKRRGSTHFHHNLRDFFAEAAARRPDIFQSGDNVMMVEAGTEIKSGAGRVTTARFSVDVH